MKKNILIYNSGGGLGDSIQLFPLILTLKKNFEQAEFYYLGAHENHFLGSPEDYKINIKTLDLGLKYFGFRIWHFFAAKNKFEKCNIEKFDLIIDLQSKTRNTLILKRIPHKYFISPALNYGFSKPKIKIEKNGKLNNEIISAINVVFNKDCKLIDYDVSKIDRKFEDEAKKLLPSKNYVGFSITQGNIYRKKEWSLDNIVILCEKLKQFNKVPVFFIEKKNQSLKKKIENMIPNSLFPEHESDLSSPTLVTCLAKRLDFVISIDNGVMHMLSLSKIPMIILFGPTDPKKFAPTYNKSIILDSKKIYNTSDISKITVEDVLQAAKHFSNF